ncbi:MAG TPA: cyclic nucleotide-binding domain-containing protein [Candidatus Marinimicrobia bacterium]|nr:cyclic nucleotide-binding domain-containing protein [Candidatus Neomarinimicrobiota bacterium]HIN62711.1 cyclic nucleotide-binding domain-containing protein [Candidatus Neomarinimicrobiota bacterium]HIO36485.1 cyclic nucleotide-binding domain-containing protein [Candidatus Neomarinimicrobiota bacterium]HIO55836.1 cyclic nucleotide-binding domain-containing protein [Candidatus Neomarinimicrobiota bacterium]HIO73908.1 cyclic nucleotide-binding domain-containing protein [Candidatus Neomarinimic
MKNALWPNLFRNWNRTESETVYTLRQVPIYKDFSKKEFTELEKLVHHRTYASGDFVFKNRAPGEGMYIIMKGTIKITIGTRSGDEKVLAELKEGDFFGELALFDNEPRSANALATTDSKLIGFFTADLLSLQDRNPQMTNKILMNLGSMLGERLRSTNHLLLEAQIKSHDEADTAD